MTEAEDIYVAFADPYSGRVIGAYSDQDKAEAAAFRFSQTPNCYDGLQLRVLKFHLNSDGEITEETLGDRNP